MKTVTLEIPACQSIEQAAKSMVEAVRVGAADIIIAEFNSTWLEARKGTTVQMIIDHWDGEKLKEAIAREAQLKEDKHRLAIFPEMLETLKAARRVINASYGNTIQRQRVGREIRRLIERCENPKPETTDATSDDEF